MKNNIRFFSILAFLFMSNSVAENSIAVVINDSLITTYQLKRFLPINAKKIDKLKVIEELIKENIIVKEIEKLKIEPTDKAIQNQLELIAKNNNISLIELISSAEFKEITEKLKLSLSKLALKEVIVKEEMKKIENKGINEPDVIFDNWFKRIRAGSFIEIYEQNL